MKILLIALIATTATCDYTCEDVLEAIAQVESSNRALGIHPDGVSYGRYGVTRIALRELGKTIDISEHLDLTVDWINRYCAWEYLRLMYTRHKCASWVEAAGWYHGGDATNRAAYVQKIIAAMDKL